MLPCLHKYYLYLVLCFCSLGLDSGFRKASVNDPVYYLVLTKQMQKIYILCSNLGHFLTFRIFICLIDLIWALNIFVCYHKGRTGGPKVRFSNLFKCQSPFIAVKNISLGDFWLLIRTMRVNYALKEDPKCFSKLYYAGIPYLKATYTCFVSCLTECLLQTKKIISC